MKKMRSIIIMVIAGLALLSQVSFAAKIISIDDALTEVLGSSKVEQKDIALNITTKKAVVAKVSKDALILNDYILHIGKDKVALEIAQPGKWGDIKFLVGLDSKTAIVTKVVVTDSEEKRGKPVTQGKYLSQFIGKGPEDPIELDTDIEGVSGATVSSRAATNAAKAAVVIYQTAVLKK